MTYLSKRFIGEYTFMGIMISAYLIAISIGLELRYGIKLMAEELGAISVAISAIFLLIVISYFVLLFLRDAWFGEFVKQFTANQKFMRRFYNILIAERIMIGLSWGLGAGNFDLLPVVPLVVYLLLVITILIGKPYKKSYLNIRAFINMLICVGVQVIYLVYNLQSPEAQHTPQIQFYLPLVVLILLIIAIAMNGTALIYYIIKKIVEIKKGKINLDFDKNELNNEEKKII